ncbi:MAG: hypothetical protein K6T73_09700 [Candidatus Bathyarchaeota archaeon]|nr:hypothetical protein [Candidatus Bathyarchaeota archaeon]
MAKVKGFTQSEEAYYKLYSQHGMDARYWKGIPVVGFITKKPVKKKAKPRKTKQDFLQAHLRNYARIYKLLTPQYKKLLKYEARQYGMSGKDLFFYLMMVLANDTMAPLSYWSDFFFYWWNNELWMDILASLPLELQLAMWTWADPPTIKYEKQRGHIHICKRPRSNLRYGEIKQVLAYQNNTWTVPWNRVSAIYTRIGAKTFHYQNDIKEIWPTMVNHVESNWPLRSSWWTDIWAASGVTMSHVQVGQTEVLGSNWSCTIAWLIWLTPQWQTMKRLIIENLPQSYSQSTNCFTDKDIYPYWEMTLGKSRLKIHKNHPWMAFPTLPKGLTFPNIIYSSITTPYTLDCPAALIPIPSIGKANYISIEIGSSATKRPVMKVMKGRYFIFRYKLPYPVDDRQFALMIAPPPGKEVYRISPILRPSKAKELSFHIPPPTIAAYDELKGIEPDGAITGDTIPPQPRYRPGKSQPPLIELPEEVKPTQNGVEEYWNQCRREHEARNPGQRYWWNEP